MFPPGPDGERGAGALAGIRLFTGIARSELERVAHFMAPLRVPAGDILFRQGDRGEELYVIATGRVHVEAEMAGGEVGTLATVGPGETLGEMSLLGGARRTGTAVVREDVTGWVLHRSSHEMLRLDAGAGAVELSARLTEIVLSRLRERYAAIGAELADGDPLPLVMPARDEQAAAAAHPPPPGYVKSLLCFRHFHDEALIDAVIGGAPVLELPAGAVVMTPGASVSDLLLVLRGALDVSIRRGHSARRVRLAGPGRFVGHIGALDGESSPVVAHARDPVVFMPLPAARVRSMLRGRGAAPRRFAAGLAEDIARALRQAERPIARVAAEPSALADARAGRVA